MQFSIARLLLVVLFINFVVGASFGLPPIIGFPLLTFVALFAVPPFIIVGAVNTRGRRQAFFLGAIVAGVPHFIITAYLTVVMAISFSDWSSLDLTEFPNFVHALGFLVGAVGGLFGMASHWFLTRDEAHLRSNSGQPTSQQLEPSSPPEIYGEDEIRLEHQLNQNEKTALPK